jgi:hypothetical protein
MSLESFPVLGFRPILLALTIAVLVSGGMQMAHAQPRSAAAPRQAPALPQSGHQTEAIDLNEGKSAQQMFASDCAVCHQKPNGLAKGRSAGQLAGFLRQHYTTGTQQAGMLAAYLTSDGLDRGAPAPAVARDAPERPGAGVPVVRPPAPIGTARRPADGDDADGGPADARRKPAATEASRPADRDGPAGRKPAREETRKPPAASARASKPAAPEIKQSDSPAAAPETPAAEQAPAASPPAEEKPAAPPPPPVPEIRI